MGKILWRGHLVARYDVGTLFLLQIVRKPPNGILQEVQFHKLDKKQPLCANWRAKRALNGLMNGEHYILPRMPLFGCKYFSVSALRS